MYTQCPECMTVFSIDAATVAQAHGCVGCGHCGATFDSMATLSDELPPAPFESLELNHPGAEPPLLVLRIEQAGGLQPHSPEAESTDAIGIVSSAGSGPMGDDAPSPDELGEHTPDVAVEDEESELEQWLADQPEELAQDELEVREGSQATLDLDAEIAALSSRLTRRERMGAPLRKRLLLGCVSLAVCLSLQLAWAERAALARSPVTGAWMRSVCDVLHCAAMVKDLDQLALVSRDVRKHPSVANALIISATIRNTADFPQPFPIVNITLSDLDDNLVAMRRFRPPEYLHDPDVRAAGLAPGASTALVFEVQDPGQNAVAFEFSFE